MKRVVVVGGGIAGLTTALHLEDRAGEVPGGLEVIILEASSRAGGNIQTDRVDGFLIEKGPNGYLDNVPATGALVRRLGLEEEVQKADDSAAKRYLYRGGRLHRLPTGPLGFLKSPVLSLPGRLRVFGEPLARAKTPGVDESIFDFASRRIGPEAASVLIDAMVSGVFAGDVRKLSLASAFPKMAAMEEEHGGLVRAMVARMRERRAARREVEERRRRGEEVDDLVRPGGPAGPGGTLTSFRQGLDTLPRALAEELGPSVRYGEKAVFLDWGTEEAKWTIRTASGESLSADGVVLAVPSPNAHRLLETVDLELANAVEGIPTAGLAVVALAFPEAATGGPLDGFGFLVPRGEGPRMLGCLWDSSIFPGRAPNGSVLLRVMIGGAHDPDAVGEEEEALISQVLSELGPIMAIRAEPSLARVYRWPLGIGQYLVGHGAKLDEIQHRLGGLGPLWLAGSSFYGVSMNACIEKAGEHAAAILARFSR